ncbi:MAG: hypothetical protein ACPGO5_04780 [Patescibacteria group bacterium]
MLFSKPSFWQQLWPFHRKKSLWEKYEPLWFVLISLTIIMLVAFGLKSAISNRVVSYDQLYISPTSYSYEGTDFFVANDFTDHMSAILFVETAHASTQDEAELLSIPQLHYCPL